jgi:hypothetical protein
MDTLHADLCTFMIVCFRVFLELEMFQTKVVEKFKTHILCSVRFNWKLYRLWDNVEKYVRARQVTVDDMILRMRFACWITNATCTHSEYEMLIDFPWQLWLLLYIHCLVVYSSKMAPNLQYYLHSYCRGEKLGTYQDAGWMVALRGRSSAANTTPLASLIFNLQRPQGGKPALLSFSELQLIFRKVC